MIILIGGSKGIGKDIKKNLISSNKEVIYLSRTIDQEYKNNFFECDVTNYSSIKNVVKSIKLKNKEIEAVINTAGIASMNMAVTTDNETVNKIIQTNLMGTINCCQLFAPLMIRKKKGCFINFSTIAVSLAIKGESIYSASKAGVEAFSRVFAREMADFNIRVNCIAPGPINTNLLKGVNEKQITEIISRQIIQKQFDTLDIFNLVSFLIDDKSSSLSGQVFHIGGV